MEISVVIPVLNEEGSIRALLDKLLGQYRPPDEIVVTDGGSIDKTASIVETYAEQGRPVRLIRAGAALPGRGRNLAAANASYDWLAFIDAGVEPAPDWLDELVSRATEEPGVDVVYGSWEPITDTFFKECAAIAYLQPPSVIDGIVMREQSITSCLMRAEAWRKAGGFPEHLRSAEDLLFMDRVQEAKFRIAYAPRALVHWSIQGGPWGTFKRFASYSRHNIRAGLWKRWQAPVLKRYLMVALSVPLVFVFGLWWLGVTALLWILMIGARAAVALRRNRHAFPASFGQNSLRWLALVPIIATLDLATLVGSIHWLIADAIRPAQPSANVKQWP